jgi:hypothetical protein
MRIRLFVLLSFALLCDSMIAKGSAGSAKVIFRGQKNPIAAINLEQLQNETGCSAHLGTFLVHSIAYPGVSDEVGGIRVTAVPAPPPEAPRPVVPSLISIDLSGLSQVEKSWMSTLVRPGRKLLIEYDRCGSGGFDSAINIYAFDALSW